jgi:FAD/FMN-containing dehydrogenase
MATEMTRRDFVLAASAGTAVSLSGLLGCEGGRRPSPRRAIEAVTEAALRDFTAGFRGTVIRSADSGYDVARRLWNARFDYRPGIIARCSDEADVVRAVNFARTEQLVVAVRGGGHSPAGHSGCDGGIVIDLSGMKGIGLDRPALAIRADPGVVAGELDFVSQGAGLAMVLAECSTVGIGGFTLGGGQGLLSCKYGLGCDNLLSAQVVLADGRSVAASPDENPELFWALRGGGGNFGIVTSLRLRAHPLKQVVAGTLTFDLAQAPVVLRAYRAFAPSAPDELTTAARFVALPSGPALALQVCFAGDATTATPSLASLRGFGKPLADTLAPRPYLEAQGMDPDPPAGVASAIRTGFLPTLEDDLIDALADLASKAPPDFFASIYPIQGAVTRVPKADTAFPLRERGFDFFVTAGWQDEAQRAAAEEWIGRAWEAVRPRTRGAYVNLLEAEGDERVRAAYGDSYERLRAVKRTYDPDNLFQLNQNIAPG